MILDRVSRARLIRIADPEIRSMRTRLSLAVKGGTLAPPGAGRHYLAIGSSALSAEKLKGTDKSAILLLLLEGPSPINAKRLPASIVALPLAEAAQQDLGSIVGSLVKELEQPRAGDAVDFCNIWRSHKITCEKSGERVSLGPSGRALDSLLAGETLLPEHPFWSEVVRTCEREQVQLTHLINHVLSRHTLWFSPYTGKPVSPAEAATICTLMHAHWQKNDLPGHCFGAQYWNHPSIGATFTGCGGEVQFHETEDDTLAAARANKGRVYSWAGRTSAEFEAECQKAGIALSRIEDGFLRSVGLGAGLARGAMLAVDDLGIYYDPSRPSRLEVLLQEYDLRPEELERGDTLVDLLKRARISKYNFGKTRSYDFPADKTKILVPGQVADDAAIRKSRSATIDCANTANVNLDLLRLTRERHPEAFLIFKPHPDVETGLRKGKVPRDTALEYADTVAEDANIIDLIEAVDAVETFSSLSGYEALLRGKDVAVHGAPFYAGWGLCEDLTPLEGRGRQRTLPELVYLSLVAYARTIDPVSLLPCTPEFLISRLSEQRNDRRHLLTTAVKRHASWLGRKLGL